MSVVTIWVGRRKELILGYASKNDEKINSGSKGLSWISGLSSARSELKHVINMMFFLLNVHCVQC